MLDARGFWAGFLADVLYMQAGISNPKTQSRLQVIEELLGQHD
jgi:hypothetical protein